MADFISTEFPTGQSIEDSLVLSRDGKVKGYSQAQFDLLDATTWGASPVNLIGVAGFAYVQYVSNGAAFVEAFRVADDGGLRHKESSFINVKDFGAVGDGVADDSVALQSALDEARDNGGGVVFIPSGVFLVGVGSDNGQLHDSKIKGGLKVGSNTTLQGEGEASAIKIAEGSYPNASWSKMNCLINDDLIGGNSNIVVKDLMLDGNTDAAGMVVANEQEGLDFKNVDNLKILRCKIYNQTHDSIDLDNCSNVLIEGNHITHSNEAARYNGIHCGYNSALGIFSNNVIIVNNIVENCGAGRADGNEAGIHNSALKSVTANNIVINCKNGIRAVSGTSQNTNIANNVIINSQAGSWGIIANIVYSSVDNNQVYYDSAGGHSGIKIGDDVSPVAGVVSCSGNTIRSNEQGIEVNCTGHCNIVNNNIQGANYLYAIRLRNAAHVCSNNLIGSRPSSAGRGAIHIDSTAAGSQVNNNTFEGVHAGRAIIVAANDTAIRGNNILSASTGGTEVEILATADDCMLIGNRIGTATTQAVSIVAGANRSLITSNNFNGSLTAVLDNGTLSSITNNIS